MMIKHDIPAHELVRYACAHARHITQQARHYNTAQPHQILIVSASAQPPAHMRQMLSRISARTTGSRPPATPGVHHSHRATRESRRQLPSRRGRPPAAPTRPRAARPAGRRWPRPAACAPHTRGASALDTWRRAALPTPAAGTRSVVSGGPETDRIAENAQRRRLTADAAVAAAPHAHTLHQYARRGWAQQQRHRRQRAVARCAKVAFAHPHVLRAFHANQSQGLY